MNLRVNLTKRVETVEGPRYCPAVMSNNGRVKADWVVVDGEQERHPEGAYYIEWRDDGQRRRLSVGKDAAQAQAQRLRKEAELNAVANGIAVAPSSDGSDAKGRQLEKGYRGLHRRNSPDQEEDSVRLYEGDRVFRGVVSEAVSDRN
jgi:hypothetical protein